MGMNSQNSGDSDFSVFNIRPVTLGKKDDPNG